MAETELQSRLELNKQVEEMKFTSEKLAEDRNRHFEEQRLHSQNMEKQLLEMKEILISMAARDRVQASSDRVAHQVLAEMPELFADKIDLEIAHQVLDEMPESQNCIKHDLCVDSLKDNDEGLCEIVNRIERDEERPTNSDEKDKTTRAHSITNGDEGLIENVLKIDVALEQDLAAHHVLERMTRIIDEFVVLELEFESAPVSSVGELDDSRTFNVSDLKDATSLLLFKNKFTDLLSLLNEMPAQEEIRMNYREVLCFDPGGGFLDLVGDSFKFEIVPLESSNLGSDEELTKRNIEKVEFVPKVEDYGDCLPSFYPTNGQIFEMISVCAGMLNFDPGGRELRNLAEPFPHRFHFVRSSLLKFVVLKEISCPVLCSLDDTQLLVDANNESLIFDPGGEEFVFGYLNLLRLNTVQYVKDVCSNLMPFDPGGECSMSTDEVLHEIKQSMEFVLVLQLGYFHDSALKLLILEDKDHLNKGELLQENGLTVVF